MQSARIRTTLFRGTPLADRPIRFAPAIRSPAVIRSAADVFPLPQSTQGVLGDTYAVIEIGGAQQIVEEGRYYSCHRLNVPVGSLIKLPRVLLMKQNGEYEMGEPFIPNATVEAEILEDYRGPKIMVYKFKAKKHYKRTKGHRQEMTRFRVTKISME